MKESGIKFDQLKRIAISHNHWDHKNGLKMVLEKSGNKPDVYVVEKEHDEKYTRLLLGVLYHF